MWWVSGWIVDYSMLMWRIYCGIYVVWQPGQPPEAAKWTIWTIQVEMADWPVAKIGGRSRWTILRFYQRIMKTKTGKVTTWKTARDRQLNSIVKDCHDWICGVWWHPATAIGADLIPCLGTADHRSACRQQQQCGISVMAGGRLSGHGTTTAGLPR